MSSKLTTICNTWIRAVQPEKIILFGSQARDKAGSESDLDFLVIWEDRSIQNNRQKAIFLRRLLPREVHVLIDLIVMTPKEYREATSDPRTFTSLISQEGKVLYERVS
jgi:predicted nucleotidyltransferase